MSLMSSDVSGELLVPPDSPGSSVSTTLQEEYDELLRYAVVVPSEPHTLGSIPQSMPLFRQLVDAQNKEYTQQNTDTFETGDDKETLEGTRSDSEVTVEEEEAGSQGLRPTSSTPREDPTPQQQPRVAFSHSDVIAIKQNTRRAETTRDYKSLQSHSERLTTTATKTAQAHNSDRQHVQQENVPAPHFSTRMRPVSHDESVASSRYSEDNSMVYTSGVDVDIARMDGLLDQWSADLKRNVLAEFGQSKIKTLEQHKQEVLRINERHNAEKNQLRNEIENMKELLHTFEKSVQRKDQIISNLTGGIQKQKEKTELLRTFCEWKMNHNEARKESFATNLARRHYERALTRRAWCAWHSVIENKWRARVEKACQARAQQVCLNLTNQYEMQIAELNGQLAAARDEVASLRSERERYEEHMKKAFMRGVCALNMEAIHMFSDDERVGASAMTSAREHGTETQTGGTGFEPATSSAYHEDTHQTTGTTRKPKNNPTRVSAKVDTGRHKGNTPLAPPMTSVVVERHPPVNKQTIGQATASQYPVRQSQSAMEGGASAGGGGGASGKPGSASSNSIHVKAPHLQTIKVVD